MKYLSSKSNGMDTFSMGRGSRRSDTALRAVAKRCAKTERAHHGWRSESSATHRRRNSFGSLMLAAVMLLGISGISRADAGKSADYTLGPDDVIDITVRPHANLDKTLTVMPDGTITYPEVGEIRATGKTAKELAGVIKEGLEKTRNDVSVFITLKEMHSRRIRVVGAVKVPGPLDLKADSRLMNIIAETGGFTAKPVAISGRIVRGGTQVINLDVVNAVARPDSNANIKLEPGDLVLFDEIPVTPKQVHVLGQVAKPGIFDLTDDATVYSILSQAGNATEKAALTKAYVIRGGSQIPMNLRPMLVEGKSDAASTGFKLQNGDVLFVPENEVHYAVMGTVGKPGYYPIPEKGEVTVLQAVNLAGGATGGDLGKAAIVRMVDGKAAVTPINIDSMLRKGATNANVALRPDDILYIPSKDANKHGLGMMDILAPFSALNILGLRFFH